MKYPIRQYVWIQKEWWLSYASTTTYRLPLFRRENSAINEAVDRLVDALAEPLLDPKMQIVNVMQLMLINNGAGTRWHRFWQVWANFKPSIQVLALWESRDIGDKPNSKLQDELIKFIRHYSGNLMNGAIYSNKSLDELSISRRDFCSSQNKRLTPVVTKVPAMTDKEKVNDPSYTFFAAKPYRLNLVLIIMSPIFVVNRMNSIGYLIGNHSAGTLATLLQDQDGWKY